MCGCVFYSKDDVNSTFFSGGGGGLNEFGARLQDVSRLSYYPII